MAETSRHDAWQAGDHYDAYMGRWSRKIAPLFLQWLDARAGADWLEVGCGTGALSAAILLNCNPKSLTAIDQSEGFLAKARAEVEDARATFDVGDMQALTAATASKDLVVSALTLNFVPDRQKALAEMRRVCRKGGRVAFYVWDYPGGGVEFMRAFWNAAVALDPAAHDLTEGRRFPFCTPEGLMALASAAGLEQVECTALEAPTLFRNFDDYWTPFTLGAGPAPGYCAALEAGARERLRQALYEALPQQADGSIALKTRAWAVKGFAGE